ncbi:MAG: hypothetical protein NTX28_07675 [Novosphingobium sp.]|nr:hypothetical protein [Novosphingobium sp.]
MGAAIDITGEKFGRLTAIGLLPKPNPKRIWSFACDCGGSATLTAGVVRHGKTRSCGCLRKETTAATRRRDLTGMVVGRLTVLGLAADRHSHNRIAWDCLCECGVRTTKNTHALGKKNPTLSCGCVRREQMRALGLSSRKENPLSKAKAHQAARRKKRRANPVVAVAERMSRMLCWALAGVDAVKSGTTFDALGYTPADLKAHLEKQFTEGMSWGNRDQWEIDHITPISSARTPEDVMALNQLWNLRPLWADLNNAKKNRREFLI